MDDDTPLSHLLLLAAIAMVFYAASHARASLSAAREWLGMAVRRGSGSTTRR